MTEERKPRIVIPKCAWKYVAENDELKIRQKISTITLNPQSPCYSCSGIRVACENYVPRDGSKVDVDSALAQLVQHYPDYGLFSGLGELNEPEPAA